MPNTYQYSSGSTSSNPNLDPSKYGTITGQSNAGINDAENLVEIKPFVSAGGTPQAPQTSASEPQYDYLTPEDPNAIRDRYFDEMEKQKAAINELYRTEYEQAAQARKESLATTGAVLTKRGAVGMGTPFETTAREGVETQNRKVLADIDARKNAAIQSAMFNYKQLEQKDMEANRALAAGNRDYAQKINEQNRNEAVNIVSGLAKGGMSWDEIEKSQGYQGLLKKTGGDDLLFKASFFASTPVDQKVFESTTNGKYTAVYMKPDKTTYNVSVDVPVNPNDSIDWQDGYMVITHWEGEPKKSKFISREMVDLDPAKRAADLAKTKADTAKTYADMEKAKADDKVLSIKDAQTLGVPYGTTVGEARALGKVPGEGTAPSPYQEERTVRNLQSIEELMPQIGIFTTGPAGLAASKIPGTDAYNFAAELDTLKSNIAFGELTAMREASKTGGALGQVSDKEAKLLEASLGALDIGQSPTNFRRQLQKIKDSIERWKNEADKTEGNVVTAPDGQEIIITD